MSKIPPELKIYDEAHDFVEAKLKANDFKALRLFMTKHTCENASRGIQRTILMALKPIRLHPEIDVEFTKLANSLRSTSSKGMI